MALPLNQEQREAAYYTDGHILVLAGAGTGKTTMLMHRLIYLLENNFCSVDQVLLTTFTTKAADEMKRRINDHNLDPQWIGTFHSLCGKIVRTHAVKLGLSPSFGVVDGDKQKYLMHKLFGLRSEQVNEQVQQWKNQLLTCDDIQSFEEYAMEYKQYQRALAEEEQLDFSDLLIMCCKLWEQNPEILQMYQEQFKYICVDEFQDANHAQMHWLKLLIDNAYPAMRETGCKLFCVGDDDQMIYSWRNTNPAYILDFQTIFKDAKILKLRQNYRSTQVILKGALDIVSKNTKRFPKVLLSNSEHSDLIVVKSFLDDKQEGKWIAQDIFHALSYLREQGKTISIGILMRTVWQVNEMKRILNEFHVTDKSLEYLLQHLRFIFNPTVETLLSVVNASTKGIGSKTLEKFQDMYGRVTSIEDMRDGMLVVMRTRTQKDSIEMLFIQLQEWIECKGNIRELMVQLCGKLQIPSNIGNLLLQQLSYTHNIAEFVSTYQAPKISIMTIHAAKGLEFDLVYLPGWEEKIFPHVKSILGQSIDEERRLAYVAITRAKRKVVITHVMMRESPRGIMKQLPSRFINDISGDLVSVE